MNKGIESLNTSPVDVLSAGDPHRARFCAARAARSVVTAAQPAFTAAPARATVGAHRFCAVRAEVAKAAKTDVAEGISLAGRVRTWPTLRGRAAARGQTDACGQGVVVSPTKRWFMSPGWRETLHLRATVARGRTASADFLGSLRICSASFSPTSNKEVVRSHDCLEACSIRHGNKVVPRKRRPYILFSFMSNLMGFPAAPTLPNRRGMASFRKGCAWAGGWAHASCSLLVALRR